MVFFFVQKGKEFLFEISKTPLSLHQHCNVWNVMHTLVSVSKYIMGGGDGDDRLFSVLYLACFSIWLQTSLMLERQSIAIWAILCSGFVLNFISPS